MLKTLTIILVLLLSGCLGSSKNVSSISPVNDPNFTIVDLDDSDTGFTATNRKVVVFDIPIYAFAEVEDYKLLHTANIMAQYLDNNEDGRVDNQTLHTTLKNQKASLFMWKTEEQIEKIKVRSQDLGADETVPNWHIDDSKYQFDASLEEVLHVITHSGYNYAYPTIFGEKAASGEEAGSKLADAMDVARGGRFTTIPQPYPQSAWYTYDDASCVYECMVTEYIYWALTSLLGAQKNRLEDIKQEWDLNTAKKVKSTDSKVADLLTDAKYNFPTKLPDGTYKR